MFFFFFFSGNLWCLFLLIYFWAPFQSLICSACRHSNARAAPSHPLFTLKQLPIALPTVGLVGIGPSALQPLSMVHWLPATHAPGIPAKSPPPKELPIWVRWEIKGSYLHNTLLHTYMWCAYLLEKCYYVFHIRSLITEIILYKNIVSAEQVMHTSSLNLLAVRNWVSSVGPTLVSCIILSHLRIFTRILFATLRNIIQYFF